MISLVLAVACSQGAFPEQPADAIQMFLKAFGADTMTADEVQKRFASGERFRILDRGLLERCVYDLDATSSRASVHYVFGMIIARKDALQVEIDNDRAVVTARGAPSPVAVLRRTKQGWKIVLAESVPKDLPMPFELD